VIIKLYLKLKKMKYIFLMWVIEKIFIIDEIPFVTHEYFQRAKLSESSNSFFISFVSKMGFQRTSK